MPTLENLWKENCLRSEVLYGGCSGIWGCQSLQSCNDNLTTSRWSKRVKICSPSQVYTTPYTNIWKFSQFNTLLLASFSYTHKDFLLSFQWEFSLKVLKWNLIDRTDVSSNLHYSWWGKENIQVWLILAGSGQCTFQKITTVHTWGPYLFHQFGLGDIVCEGVCGHIKHQEVLFLRGEHSLLYHVLGQSLPHISQLVSQLEWVPWLSCVEGNSEKLWQLPIILVTLFTHKHFHQYTEESTSTD